MLNFLGSWATPALYVLVGITVLVGLVWLFYCHGGAVVRALVIGVILLLVVGALAGLGWLFYHHPFLMFVFLVVPTTLGLLMYLFPSIAIRLGEMFAVNNNIYGNIALVLIPLLLCYSLFNYGVFIERSQTLNPAEQIAHNIREGKGPLTDDQAGMVRVSTNDSWLHSWEWAIGLSILCFGIFLWSRMDEIQRSYRRARRAILHQGDREINLPTPEAERLAQRAQQATAVAGGTTAPTGGRITIGQRIFAESSGELIGQMLASVVTSVARTFIRR